MVDHCSQCGHDYPLSQAFDGYTGCCNEPVCDGGPGVYTYELATDLDTRTPAGTLTACCNATAEAAAKARGLSTNGRIN